MASQIRLSNFINNSPHFFKVVPTPASQGLSIPASFMHKYGDSLKTSSAVVLKVSTGATYRVQLRRTDTGTWLGQGWEQFSTYYDIKPCDFLVFNYAGNSQFDVEMFDEKSSCKTLDPEPEIGNIPKTKVEWELELSSSSESSDESDVEIYEPPIPKPRRENGIRDLKRKLTSSSSESSDDDVEIYEPRRANKVQKSKMKMKLESEEDDEDDKVEIREPKKAAVRRGSKSQKGRSFSI